MARITLKNVRLSYESVFKKANFNGEETKYECTMLLSKDDKETYKKVMEAIDSCKVENKIKVGSDKLFIKDGDDVDSDGYENMWAIKAANNKRPTVINRDKSPIVEDDDIIYSGCYANVIIEPWGQNNNWGKRVNANLLGVQFVKDGQPFGDGGSSANADDFDDIEDEEL